MGLRRRLERLEKVYGGGRWEAPPCEECGGGGGAAGDDSEPDEYELTFPGDYSDDPGDDPADDPVEEFCSSCGRQLTWVLRS